MITLKIIGIMFSAVTTATILIAFVVVYSTELPIAGTPIASISKTTR